MTKKIMSEEQELHAVPVGENLREALEHAHTPMAALAAAYNHSPMPGVRVFINQKVEELLAVELPKLQLLMVGSPVMDADDLLGKENCETHMQGAIQSVTELGTDDMKRGFTKTIEDASLNIAREVDKAIKRVVLDEDKVNRAAVLDILSAQASISASLVGLLLDDDQREMAARFSDREDK